MKTRINRRRTKKRQYKGGTIVIGEGGYGTYYGDPRLRCSDETEYDYENISKLFKNENAAFSAYKTMERITKSSLYRVKNISNYFVLPIKMCDSKKEDLIKNNIEINEQNLIMISARASRDLFDETSNILFKKPFTEDIILDLHSIMKNLENIFLAVRLLQQYNFIHADIRRSNILIQNDVYKLGDLDTMNSILTKDELFYPLATSPFYNWPALSVYSIFFSPSLLKHFNMSFNGKVSGIELTPEYLDKISHLNVAVENKENNSTAQNDLDFFRKKFGTFLANKEDVSEIERIYETIKQEKIFNFTSQEELSNYLERWNSHFQSMKNMKDAKLDLYKRADIYSLGVVILDIINVFTSEFSVSKANTKHIDAIFIRQLNSILFSFYKIIEKCCVQVENPPSIDEICQDYHRSIKIFDVLIQTLRRPVEEKRRKIVSTTSLKRRTKTKHSVRINTV